MNPRARFLPLGAIIVCVIILVLILPAAISTWLLNFGNANLARVLSLPDDSPARTNALQNANELLGRARIYSEPPRLALADARQDLANNDSQIAVQVLQIFGNDLVDDFIAQFLWGNAEWSAGNRDAAYQHWRNAGAQKYFVEQAQRALARDDWTQAEDNARIAIGIAPADAESHLLLADALIHQGNHADEAMRELERAAQIVGDSDPEFLSTILSRQGELLAIQGKSAQAITYFDRARTVAPKDARPRTDYARAILQIDPTKTSEARALLTQVVTDSPWYVDAYVLLADISERDSDTNQAEKWYKSGLDKNPNDARLLFPLGEFYARQNRSGDAKETLTLALKNETRPDVLQAIARSLAKIK